MNFVIIQKYNKGDKCLRMKMLLNFLEGVLIWLKINHNGSI